MRARSASIIAATLGFAIVLAFLLSPHGASAQIGGGYINGYVFSFDQYDQLVPVGYADITAENSMYTFHASSAPNGFYEMYLPTGTFTFTISSPGYKDYSMSVAVSNGSSSPLNFYLQRSEVPVPEFSTYLAAVAMLVAFASVTILTRRLRQVRR